MNCTLLPGSWPYDSPVPILYNQAYRYWRKIWGEVFLKAGSPGSLNTENFLRQDVVICLHVGNNIIGMLTQNLFNLGADASYDHAYFQPFPKELIERLRSEGRGFVTTAEYLSVHPEFRKSIAGISFSEILIGLMSRVFTQMGGRMALCTTVKPAHVPESCLKFGWVQTGVVQKYGLDCLLMYGDAQTFRGHPEAQIEARIQDYWAQRRDWTKLTKEIKRRAA